MLPDCHEIFTDAHGLPLPLTLFMGAMVGSFSHCAGMCGPFVLAQTSGFSSPQGVKPESWYRQLLLPYHAGRLSTYTVLGVATSLISMPILQHSALHLLPPLLLVVAGILFLASAFSQTLPAQFINISLCGTPSWITKRIVPLLPSHSLFSGYLLGTLLGFLPCGLVYAAILAVAATGNPFQAAWGMLAFAAGTMPTLLVISLGGKKLINKKYSWIRPASAILMAGNSMMLFAMAGKGLV